MRLTMRFFTLTTFVFLSIISLFAQNAPPPPDMKFGEIKNADLLMTKWESDTAAEAAVLGEIGAYNMRDDINDRYGFELIVHRRVKIFKKSAFERANIVLTYRSEDNWEFYKDIKAHTILPNGVKVPVEKKEIRTEKLDKEYSSIKFTFPKVAEGCVLEYEYTKSTRNIFYPEWYFQEDIPVRFSVLYLRKYINFEYTFLSQGMEQLKQTKLKEDMADKMHSLSFYAENLPGLKDETFVTSLRNYLVHMRFQLTKYFDSRGGKQEFNSDWRVTENQFLANDGIGKRYLKKGSYDKVAEAAKGVYAPTDEPKEKMLKLYNWVNQQFKCDGERWLGELTPNDLWQKKKANSYAEINLLLIALLREAGLEANPVLLSPRDYGKHYIDFPIVDQFRHAIAAVDMPNNTLTFLDAGRSNLPFGLPHVNSLNNEGWHLKKGASKWINIKPSSSNTLMIANVALTEDGNLVGNVNASAKGYAAKISRDDYKGDVSGMERKAAWVKRYADWKIDSLTASNLDKTEEALKERMTCIISNAAQVNENMMYLKPALKSGWEVNPFKLENRTYPVEIPYPTNDQYTLVISLPKGYKVEEIPKPLTLSLPPDDCKFMYQVSYDSVANNLTVYMKIQVNKTNYPPEEYKYLRNFFKQVAAKLEEMIVLKKEG
jgi:hypothetical protein